MLMSKLFKELKRHDKFPFDLEFVVKDPGYNELNRTPIEYNAQTLGIPVGIFETSIFDAVDSVGKSPCYLCARAPLVGFRMPSSERVMAPLMVF